MIPSGSARGEISSDADAAECYGDRGVIGGVSDFESFTGCAGRDIFLKLPTTWPLVRETDPVALM